MLIDYEKELRIMRKKIKKHKIKPLKLTKPSWMETDKLNKIYTDMDILLQYGEVYWGVLVQANMILFQKEPYVDCPGDILFTINEDLNKDPQVMSAIAHRIFSYKNTTVDAPYLKRVVEIITDEKERIFNYPINLNEIYLLNDYSTNYQKQDKLFFTTIMFFRDYMPSGVLQSGIFPILAAPQHTDISIMLPKKYWTWKTKKMFLKNGK